MNKDKIVLCVISLTSLFFGLSLCAHVNKREKFQGVFSSNASKAVPDRQSSLLFTIEKDVRKLKQNGQQQEGKFLSETSQSSSEEYEESLLKDMVDANLPYSGLSGNELDGWIENITCEACEYMIRKLQVLANDTTTYNKFIDETIRLCIFFGINDKRICTMMIDQYKFVAHYVLVHLILKPGEACGIVLGKQCSIPYFPGNMWNVTLPDTPKPAPNPPAPPKPGSPTLRFLQITDIHIDFQYVPNTPSKCTEPLCCRTNVDSDNGYVSGEFGDYHKCDIPDSLAVSLFQHLATKQDEFDYIIFTGDIPAHDLWNQSREDQLTHYRTLDNLFQTYLPFKPVYYAIGNHDSSPCDSYPPPSLHVEDMSWLFDTVADIWGRWLPPSTDPMIRRCASYSFSPTPGFRIISLNNIYSSRLNFWLLVEDVDPCGVLAYFVEELQKAEDAGEKVHVLTHIPPGINYMRKAWSYNYYKIVNRYSDTIVNQFYGHTHTDFFNMFYDEKTFKRPLGVGFVTPSVTAYKELNPTYRIFTMDGNYEGSSFAVLDYVTYYLNLTNANEVHSALQWEYEYSPKELFNMTGLYPEDWDDLINRMQIDEDLFQKFYRVYNNNHPVKHCGDECKKHILCSLWEGRSYDHELCKIHWRKNIDHDL